MAVTIPKHPLIYCRLSYTEDGSEEKVDRQEGDVRRLFDRMRWPQPPPEHVFKDNNRSAWQRNRKRPGWDRMLDMVLAGKGDGIGVYHGDRLIRQPWDLEILLKLADDKHLPLASVSGLRDLNSEDDRFVLRIEVAQACRESSNTSRRVRRGWEASAAQGLPRGGGRRAFGFERDGVTRIEAEAAILAEAADRLLCGESQGAVVRWMRTVSTTTQGNPWTGPSLRRLLCAPRIAGLIQSGDRLHTAVWEPVISCEKWEDIKLLMLKSSQDHPYVGTQERRYLLSGIAKCGTCGSPLRTQLSGGVGRRQVRRKYRCPEPIACPRRVARDVVLLDAYMEGRVLRLLNDSEFLAGLYADEQQPGIGAEIAALERRKAEAKSTLENLVDHPEVDPGLVARSLVSFDRRIAEIRQARANSARQRLLARMAGVTREQWQAEPLDVRSATVRALYRITVLPVRRKGSGFDPDAVRVERVSEESAPPR